MPPDDRIVAILAQAKKLAQEYRVLTGKPLGITGEVAEYEAARLLGVKLTPARHAGYDATDGDGRRFQIKGRCPSARLQAVAAAWLHRHRQRVRRRAHGTCRRKLRCLRDL